MAETSTQYSAATPRKGLQSFMPMDQSNCSPADTKSPKITSTSPNINQSSSSNNSALMKFDHLHPVLQWVLYLSRQFLNVPPTKKAIFYLMMMVVCSALSEILDQFRTFYFFRKESFLNQWFVKLSWGWTFWLLLAFFILTGYVESQGRLDKVFRGFVRLVVGTSTWYIVTSFFMGIERTTGKCSIADYQSRKECQAAGNEWSHFDISGHAFLLIYCSLLILEESRAFFKWEKADLAGGDHGLDGVVKTRVVRGIRMMCVALALLALLWDGMLIITLIFYHNILQRVLGVLLGVGGWFFTYKIWYPVLYPGLPGCNDAELRQISQ